MALLLLLLLLGVPAVSSTSSLISRACVPAVAWPHPCRVWVAFMAVTVKVLHLASLELVWGALLGLLWGLGLVLLYQINRKRKAERGQLVRDLA